MMDSLKKRSQNKADSTASVNQCKEDPTLTIERTPSSPARTVESTTSVAADAEEAAPVAGGDANGSSIKAGYYELPEDSHALLFTSRVNSVNFLYALLSPAFQVSIMSLLLVDLLSGGTGDNPLNLVDILSGGTGDNPLNIPPGVSGEVRASQFIALILSPITQNDFMSSLDALVVQYDGDLLKSVPAATQLKWRLSNISRSVMGCLYIVVLFILIMQSENVLSVFLNFAALQFIMEIDDLAYKLADSGYVGRTLEEVAKRHDRILMSEKRIVPLRIGGRGLCAVRTKVLRSATLLLVIAALIIGGAVVALDQASGKYLTNSITVQFGDEVWEIPGPNSTSMPSALHYSYFSGVYEHQSGVRENMRPVYYERGRDPSLGHPPPGKFSYCQSEQAWVFSIDGIKKVEDPADHGCNWLMRSPTTTSFDLTDVPLSGWALWTGVINLPPIEYFSIVADECSEEVECNLHGSCDGRTKRCRCDEGWFGTTCQYEEPCDVIGVASEFDPEARGETDVQTFFQLLRDRDKRLVLLYDRPVYYRNVAETSSFSQGISTVLYTGRRWYVVLWPNRSVDGLLEFFHEDRFPHAYWDNVHDLHKFEFSDPTDGGTPVGVSFNDRIYGDFGDFGPYGYFKKKEGGFFHCLEGTCDRCRQFDFENNLNATSRCEFDICICNGGCDEHGHYFEYHGYFCEDFYRTNGPDSWCTNQTEEESRVQGG